MDDPDGMTDLIQDNSEVDGWEDPVGERGAVGGAWPAGVGWGPGGAPGNRSETSDKPFRLNYSGTCYL